MKKGTLDTSITLYLYPLRLQGVVSILRDRNPTFYRETNAREN